MEEHMQRFHGTAARQLVMIDDSGSRRPRAQEADFRLGFQPRSGLVGAAPPRIRLLQKDMYAELTRRRRRAQIAARRWVEVARHS
ncbi:MAG: hypothetical protein ABIP90_12825 [Vicinamibacterales bacterium]